ncbi:phage repressor protein [Haloarcula montana]|uniref:phage repressor protein n=1 Tax=Haloarcula montana TaxID=3111776 RepID=UPI002D78F928|nr:phage repressor protein [Haloarcula sp. GH36]
MATKPTRKVKLTETDFLILGVLTDGRNIPANIALDIDRARNYINQRMPYLLDYGLVEKIGPYEDSGLYELTDRGRVAYEHREHYHKDDVDFDELLDGLTK